MYSSKCFNYNFMEVFGHEKCDKLIWTSDELANKLLQEVI